jgi:anti-sigma regulatory factor (Ser/Thr protein kinase)
MCETMIEAEFHHEAFFYGDVDEFLAGAVPYLRDAIEAGEPALVAVGPEPTRALRGEFGEDAGAVRFAPMREFGRNPARIIPFWREFLDRHGGPEWPVRGIGEPVWPGRSPHELDECRRHESLLNVAFDGGAPFALLCPYDTRRISDAELAAAAHTHPFVSGAGAPAPASGDRGGPPGVFSGALPPRPAGAASLRFGREDLGDGRDLVGRESEAAGLGAERRSDLVTAASELAANSVAHGGGHGVLWAWREGDEVVVEVGDAGLLEEPLIGRRRPHPAQDSGRGLWIANLLCDLVQIRSGDEGTAVRLRMRLDA